jgi:hypothetical protein
MAECQNHFGTTTTWQRESGHTRCPPIYFYYMRTTLTQPAESRRMVDNEGISSLSYRTFLARDSDVPLGVHSYELRIAPFLSRFSTSKKPPINGRPFFRFRALAYPHHCPSRCVHHFRNARRKIIHPSRESKPSFWCSEEVQMLCSL